MFNEKQELKNKNQGTSGLVFVGCLMLGLAAGFLTGYWVVGVLGGLGIGFITMGLAMANEKTGFGNKGASGLAFVGCLMIGLSLGFLFSNVVVGIFIGLGVGFIAMYVVYQRTGEW